MSQGHRRHGGGGYTLLYYIGLEGKEDRRTEEQKKDKRDGRQKDKGTGKRDGNLQLPSLFDATNFVTVLYGDFSLLY